MPPPRNRRLRQGRRSRKASSFPTPRRRICASSVPVKRWQLWWWCYRLERRTPQAVSKARRRGVFSLSSMGWTPGSAAGETPATTRLQLPNRIDETPRVWLCSRPSNKAGRQVNWRFRLLWLAKPGRRLREKRGSRGVVSRQSVSRPVIPATTAGLRAAGGDGWKSGVGASVGALSL